MRRSAALARHAALVVVCVLMLVPFYWVLKTSLTGENIYAYPPHLIPRDPQSVPLRRRLVLDPVPALSAEQRHRLGCWRSPATWCSTRMAGYALTRGFAGKRWCCCCCSAAC